MRHAYQTPLALREPFDVTVHMVLNDFGPLGRAYIKTDEAETDEAAIVENILSGAYSHPVWMVAFNSCGLRHTDSGSAGGDSTNIPSQDFRPEPCAKENAGFPAEMAMRPSQIRGAAAETALMNTLGLYTDISNCQWPLLQAGKIECQ